MNVSHRLVFAVCLAGFFGTPVIARAQAGSSRSPEVQWMFDEGSAALRDGRFAEARDLLRQVHSSENEVGSAFNFSVALRGTGETLECETILGGLLSGDHGELTADVRRLAEEVREDCRAANATLRIAIEGAHDATVRLDGNELGDIARGTPLVQRVAAGGHVVVAMRQGYTRAEASVQLGPGGSHLLTLSLERTGGAPPVDLSVVPQPIDDDGQGSVAEEAWFWVVIVGVVGLAAAGIALGIVFAPGTVAEPVGTMWGPPRGVP